MFDIGFAELLLIAVVALIVIGPRRMPEAVRFVGYWLGKLRRSVHNARQEMEREFGLDDIRRDLHNEAILAQLEKERRQLEDKFISTDKPKTATASEPNMTDKTDDARDPEAEQELLRAFEDFEKEFGIEPDGSDMKEKQIPTQPGNDGKNEKAATDK